MSEQAHKQPQSLDLAVCLNAYSGYPLPTALEQVGSMLDWRAVELDAIDGLFCHIDLDRITQAGYRRQITTVLTESRMACRAVSAQRPAVDRLDAGSLRRMSALFELTAQVGADRIILGAGTDADAFRRNMGPLLGIATSMDLTVGLETQGPRQLVHNAGCRALVESLGSDRLDVNYDFGNAYFALDGGIDMLGDFLAMQPIVGHAHFKDAVREPGGDWELTAITGSIVDYRGVLAAMHRRPIPVSIELPRRMILECGRRREQVPSLQTINADLAASLRTVASLWEQTSAAA